MVLGNYWKAFKATALVDSLEDGNQYYANVNTGMIDINGQPAKSILYRCPYSRDPSQIILRNTRLKVFDSVRIGEGTGDIQNSDYSLFHDCTDRINSLSFTLNNSGQDYGFSTVATIHGRYSTLFAPQITITEVGFVKKFASDVAFSTTSDVMLVKMLLDEPITLNAGDPFNITVEWIES